MNIDCIYVACYYYDLPLTRICIASIRYWYPDIPIYLLKDTTYREYDTREIEETWNVKVYECNTDKKFGWGLYKLHPLASNEKAHFLILDSDVVLIGPVLEVAQSTKADFIVSIDTHEVNDHLRSLYYNPDALKAYDPSFEYPGYTFNTGQIFATSGIPELSRVKKLLGLEDEQGEPIFSCADQGPLNYLLPKLEEEGVLTLEKAQFMIWGGNQQALRIVDMEDLTQQRGVPKVIHWAGIKSPYIRNMPGSEILRFYEKIYYSKVSFAPIKKWSRFLCRHLMRITRESYRRTFKKKTPQEEKVFVF